MKQESLLAAVQDAKEAANSIAGLAEEIADGQDAEVQDHLTKLYHLTLLAHQHKKEFARLASHVKKPKAGTDNPMCYWIIKFAFHKVGRFSAATMKRYAQATRVALDLGLDPAQFHTILESEHISGLVQKYNAIYNKNRKQPPQSYDWWFKSAPSVPDLDHLESTPDGELSIAIYRNKSGKNELLTRIHISEATCRRLVNHYAPRPTKNQKKAVDDLPPTGL